MNNLETKFTINELKWDTSYFGVSSAKVMLHKPLNLDEFEELKSEIEHYRFVSIINENSEPVNAQIIGQETTSFLADINIQFEKKVTAPLTKYHEVSIYQAMPKNEQITRIANFKFSKFIEDPDLEKRGGKNVYQNWLINSFENPNKFYAVHEDAVDGIDGFVLFSFVNNACLIELISVSEKKSKSGIGRMLFEAVENQTYQNGYNKIIVGTQIRNMGAINFYHKVGCRQISCHQVFHLWNHNIS